MGIILRLILDIDILNVRDIQAKECVIHILYIMYRG